MWLGIVMEKNWALSVNQCLAVAVVIFNAFINLLSIFLRYNGFPSIQKAVMDQTS